MILPSLGVSSNKIKDWSLCILSAGLLILAFPRTDLSILAWVGFIPMMFALDGKRAWSAFRTAYFCGFLFFAGTLFWFFHITQWFSYIAGVGVIFLFLYLALYFGAFGVCYSLFSRRKTLWRLFLLPSVWVVLEFIRAHLFTGFDWVSLGHSQYKNLLLIQMADVTGVFGVSFIIVMVNVLLKEWIAARFVRKGIQPFKDLAVPIIVTVLVVGAVFAYGAFRLSPTGAPREPVSRMMVAVVQANIPQEMKWDESAWTVITEKHIALSERVAAEQDLDLIIWPETSYPGHLVLAQDEEILGEFKALARRFKTSLLFGSVTKEGKDYYNSAILLSPEGEVAEVYHKVHLVPFGEFIPLRSVLPFVSELLDIGDFTAGDKKTAFSFTPEKDDKRDAGKFSVLICFEDTVARLSRQFVRGGAQLLVNMTNDAWFGDTKAPYLHLQSSVFRAVENRRGLVRAANTGASCFVDQRGAIIKCVEWERGSRRERTYVSGYAINKMDFYDQKTFYTKFGDIFTFLCFGCILLGIVIKKHSNDLN